jgi:hypothetical protein
LVRASRREADTDAAAKKVRPSRWRVLVWVAGGALLGAGVGALIGLATYQPDPRSLVDYGRGFNALVGAVIGLPVGMLAGAVVVLVRRGYFTSFPDE